MGEATGIEYRSLGRTGLQVSTYCLGTMMFGWYGNDNVDECSRIVQLALDAGINFIDTADRYSRGQAEEILGQAIRGRRDEVVLSTKAHLPMSDRPNDRGSTRHWITRAVDSSLRRLDTDYIDIYIMHRPDPRTDIEETLSVLSDLVRQGKVLYAGSSTFPAWQLVEAQAVSEDRRLERFAVEQAPYSILFRDIETDVLEVARRQGMGVMAWSPLANGLLAGRYRTGQAFERGSRGARAEEFGPHIQRRFDLSDPDVHKMLGVVERIGDLADDADISMTHLALAFTLEHPAMTSAIVGPRTLSQMEDLLAGAGKRLSSDILDALDEIVTPGSHVPSTDRRWKPPWLDAGPRRRLPPEGQ